MRVLIYLRVSTKKQEEKNQLLQLKKYCEDMGHSIVGVLSEKISGADPNRSEFKKMLAMASKREFDLLLFWSLSRFSREGVRKTIFYLEQLEACGVQFKSFTEQYLDTTGVFRDAVISILASMAQQERIRLSESVKAGLERAKKYGRVPGRPKIDPGIRKKIKDMRLKDPKLSLREIARQLKISDCTVKKYI